MTTKYFKIQLKDCFGDSYPTGKTFATLVEAKDFVRNPDKFEERKAAWRMVADLVGKASMTKTWEIYEVQYL